MVASPDLTLSVTIKPCRQCGQFKPLEEYWADHRNPDRLTVTCRECIIAKRLAKRAEETPEQRRQRMIDQRAYQAKYRATEHGRATQRSRQAGYNALGKPGIAEMTEAQRDFRRAHVAISQAKSHGLRVPEGCESCGTVGPVHGHHWHGYEPAHWLDVVWLCVTCHFAEHYG